MKRACARGLGRNQIRACGSCRRLSLFFTSGFLSAVLAAAVCHADETPSPVRPEADDESDGVLLVESPRSDRATEFKCRVTINGTVKTPATDGNVNWKLVSAGSFDFTQRRFPTDATGAFGLRAARRFTTAETSTTVGPEHQTSVNLPSASRLIHVFGSDSGLVQLSPDYRLTRPQVDLLQMPCDPLVATGLLPARRLTAVDEKWNADVWVVPLLAGIDAAVTQSAECRLTKLNDAEAVVEFVCNATGAITGSSTDVEFSGTLRFDRQQELISSLKATLMEKRSPGVISPGLDAGAVIEWTQAVADSDPLLPDSLPGGIPDERRLLLTLTTPWRVLLLHTRDWHIFHETGEMVMLRMVKDGALIAQCNLASAPRVKPGEATEEAAYLAEVQAALVERKGGVVSSEVKPDINGWRVHRITASGKANDKALTWDYCLCTASSGEQISIVFSHAEEDAAAFSGMIDQMLGSLTLRPARSRVALPR